MGTSFSMDVALAWATKKTKLAYITVKPLNSIDKKLLYLISVVGGKSIEEVREGGMGVAVSVVVTILA